MFQERSPTVLCSPDGGTKLWQAQAVRWWCLEKGCTRHIPKRTWKSTHCRSSGQSTRPLTILKKNKRSKATLLDDSERIWWRLAMSYTTLSVKQFQYQLLRFSKIMRNSKQSKRLRCDLSQTDFPIPLDLFLLYSVFRVTHYLENITRHSNTWPCFYHHPIGDQDQ